MKKILFSISIIAVAAVALMAKSKDPVLMTVDGRPVLQNEFEYLYNKNAGQQLDHQSLDEYVEMFVNYKLKVADALANKYDTTAEFQTELESYQTDLLAPYLVDKDAEKALTDMLYDHYMSMRKIAHIMFQDPARHGGSFDLIDSVRTEIVEGRLDWNEAAAKYSIDRPTSQNGGEMGWLISGRFPVAFEDMAYATEPGTISQPVNSGFGIHLIKVEEVKPNPGEVKARHILKLTARKSPEEAAKVKEQIDSIYTVLMEGADFADVARRESEDPGSNASGGELDWFGAGVMVAPFDSAAFSMAEGVISQPIETAYGWHILEVTGHRPPKTREQMQDRLTEMVSNGERSIALRKNFLDKMMKKYNGRLFTENLDEVETMVNNHPSGLTTQYREELMKSDLPLAEVAGQPITLGQAIAVANFVGEMSGANVRNAVSIATENLMTDRTIDEVRKELMVTNENYRNLMNEYSDGILLFNISQDKVWKKATADRQGLESFFQANRDKYSYDEPRFKGVIVFTTNDSIEAEVKKYLTTLDSKEVTPLTVGPMLKEKFGKNVRAERVIAKKGENAITDYLAFDGTKPEASNASWKCYFAYMGQIIDQPQEADDVKGKVTADYQNYLEAEWIKELRAKYPVKIDKKVLKKIKEISAQ